MDKLIKEVLRIRLDNLWPMTRLMKEIGIAQGTMYRFLNGKELRPLSMARIIKFIKKHGVEEE